MSILEQHSGERLRRYYSFGEFILDVDHRILLRDGEEVTLRPKSFDVLAELVDHHGQLVTKGALMETIWQDTAVTDNSLAQCMVEVRRALNDGSQKLIRTVARRGYLFAAPVTTPVVEFPRQPALTPVEPRRLPESPSVPGRIQATETRFTLRRGPVFALVVGALIVGLVWFVFLRRVPTIEPNRITSLAVLPLENLSADPAQDYFADGMTEAIIGNLARIRALKVISRTSAMRYKGSSKSLPEIARELKVDAVIEGSVRAPGFPGMERRAVGRRVDP